MGLRKEDAVILRTAAFSSVSNFFGVGSDTVKLTVLASP